MKLIFFIFSCALTILIAQVTHAVEGNEKMRIFYTAITGEQSIFWIVKESEMLQKYGIDPEMVFIDSGTLALQTMVAGDSHLGMVGSTAVVLSNLSGSGVKMIAGLVNNLTYILITDPKITRPEQLKGAKLAIARFGSLSDFGTRLALKKVGVSLSDVTLIQIGGGQPGRLQLLSRGASKGLSLHRFLPVWCSDRPARPFPRPSIRSSLKKEHDIFKLVIHDIRGTITRYRSAQQESAYELCGRLFKTT
jgi:ABC-type nitrate/sulfonate/bicarbonate transport system substrate-binding protein